MSDHGAKAPARMSFTSPAKLTNRKKHLSCNWHQQSIWPYNTNLPSHLLHHVVRLSVVLMDTAQQESVQNLPLARGHTKLWRIWKRIHKLVFILGNKKKGCPLAPLASSMLSQAHNWAPAPQRYCLLDSINSPFVVSSTTLSPCGGRQEHKMPQTPFWWRQGSHFG